MQLRRSVTFNILGHRISLALDGAIKADGKKVFLLSLIFFAMIPANEKLT